MDSKKHAEFTGAEASISRKVNGKFSCYDGWIKGENLELSPDKKIVQKWRGDDWPKGVWSKVTFKLSKTEKGTELTLIHEDVPNDKAKGISEGWKEHYWEKMKEVLEE